MPEPLDAAGTRWYVRFVSNRAGLLDRAAPTSPIVLAAVAIGAPIGAGARWGVGEVFDAIASAPAADAWPWPTLIVNIVGAFLIGLAAARFDRKSAAYAFTATGALGGFTTYSSFAVDVDHLADADRTGLAAAYAAITIVGGLVALYVALSLARRRATDPEAQR